MGKKRTRNFGRGKPGREESTTWSSYLWGNVKRGLTRSRKRVSKIATQELLLPKRGRKRQAGFRTDRAAASKEDLGDQYTSTEREATHREIAFEAKKTDKDFTGNRRPYKPGRKINSPKRDVKTPRIYSRGENRRSIVPGIEVKDTRTRRIQEEGGEDDGGPGPAATPRRRKKKRGGRGSEKLPNGGREGGHL